MAEQLPSPTSGDNEQLALTNGGGGDFSTPPPAAKGSRLGALQTGDSGVDMSPKQTKLLARLHVLMRSFKELKTRVQTMQASGAFAQLFFLMAVMHVRRTAIVVGSSTAIASVCQRGLLGLHSPGADGKGFSPDKKLFEKFREQKQQEIEQLRESHEVRSCVLALVGLKKCLYLGDLFHFRASSRAFCPAVASTIACPICVFGVFRPCAHVFGGVGLGRPRFSRWRSGTRRKFVP